MQDAHNTNTVIVAHRCSQVWPGVDFPFCPHRPTARFLLAEVVAMDRSVSATGGAAVGDM